MYKVEFILKIKTSYCMHRGIGESHRHENKEKKADTKDYSVWFHLHEVPGQAKLIHGDGNKNGNCFLRSREFRIWQNWRAGIQDSIQKNKPQAECCFIFIVAMKLQFVCYNLTQDDVL